jgi:hypothetical protein
LKGTLSYCIIYESYKRLEVGLCSFSDSDYVGNLKDQLSTYRYIFTLYRGLISWTLKKQRLVLTSTTEAEYVALCQARKQAVWSCRLLRELRHTNLLESKFTVPISCDNEAAIRLAENP